MTYRRKKQLKRLVKGILCSALFIFIYSNPVNANTGDLKINNQVIYEKDVDSQSHAATFTIPQLFMKDMSAKEKQLEKETRKMITDAQKEVFVKKTPKQPMIGQEITPLLFSKGYILADSVDSVDSKTEDGSNLLVHILLVIGGLFVTGLGILLGRAFPKWLKKE